MSQGSAEVVPMRTVTSSIIRGEIDAQVATAKAYPRNVATFKQRSTDLACLDQEVAAGCIYALARDGKPIEGPSVRFAEILAATWGNLRVATRIVDEGAKFITAQAACHDLENNTAITIEVRRRITYKNGGRYKDDMIGVTANAASAIAMRNAVLTVVPQAIWKEVYQQTRNTALGAASTLAAKRTESVEYFGKMGVTLEDVLRHLTKDKVAGRDGTIEDITLDDVASLRRIATAMKDGETTVDQAFPPPIVEKKTTRSLTIGDLEQAMKVLGEDRFHQILEQCGTSKVEMPNADEATHHEVKRRLSEEVELRLAVDKAKEKPAPVGGGTK